MIPNFIKKGIHRNGSGANQAESPASKNHPAHKELQHTQSLSSVMNDPKKKGPSMQDLMSKSGQFLNTIQGTLDKQLGQIAEAVHIATHENGEFFSPLAPVVAKDFDTYLGSVKEHWSEYKDICSSLIRARESSTTPSSEIETQEGTNAFREIPQVYFNTDYKQSGFEQHQLFTQPIRISVQNQGKMSSVLAGYMKMIEQHLVKHLSNVDGLLRSLMTIAEIQSDIAIAHDRSVYAKETLSRVQQGEVRGGLRLVLLARRKARIQTLLRVLDLCDQVSQAKPSVESLVRTGDFSAATDLVQATNLIVTSHSLTNVKALSRVNSFMEEHGRNIDGKIEIEFADLIAEIVFSDLSEEVAKIKSMISIMVSRDLLIACLQIKLKEVLTKRLKKEMKGISTSLTTIEVFSFLKARLDRLIAIINLTVSVKEDESNANASASMNMRRLSCLRLFEAICVAGLVRISQHLVQGSEELIKEGLGSLYLKELRRSVIDHLDKTEKMYLETFTSIGLEEHLSFASSVIGSASQNGYSPNLDRTIEQIAKQRFDRFHANSIARLADLLAQEKWDKSATSSTNLLAQTISSIDPASTQPDECMSPLSPSSASSTSTKFFKINKVNYLLVSSGVELTQILLDYLDLALGVPGVSLDCLEGIATLVRQCNGTSKELVLEGGLTVNQKKVINATNLALVSQLVGFLAQLVAAICRKFCLHYNVANELLVDFESRNPSGDTLLLLQDPSRVLQDLLVNVTMELNEHRMEVFVKLGDILVSRFDFHINANWVENLSGGGSPMDGIVKDFTAMYKVLLKSLQTDNLKRVFSRAFSESSIHFSDQLNQRCKILSGAAKSEFACAIRTDLLYLFQNLLVNDAMSGVRPALAAMISEMLETVEKKLPLLDKSIPAEEAVVKLKSLLRSPDIN